MNLTFMPRQAASFFLHGILAVSLFFSCALHYSSEMLTAQLREETSRRHESISPTGTTTDDVAIRESSVEGETGLETLRQGEGSRAWELGRIFCPAASAFAITTLTPSGDTRPARLPLRI